MSKVYGLHHCTVALEDKPEWNHINPCVSSMVWGNCVTSTPGTEYKLAERERA